MDDMTAVVAVRSGRNGAVLAAVAALFVACATPEPPKPAPVAPPPPVVAAPEAKPVASPVPELSPAQAKAQAQKLANESVTQLQNGEEPSAQHMLEQALALDPANDLAKKMMNQIKADPQKELGAAFFRYTVQRDDSLSKIAQQYLGDRYRFYILAKYNNIQNPNRLAAGQEIKIPGKAPSAAPTRPAAPPAEATHDAAKEPVPESATPRGASLVLMQQGVELQKNGDLEGAYEKFREAAKVDPGNKDAISQSDSIRQALARRCEREAKQALDLRQNLDEAIEKWDCVLRLEPNNQRATLERAKVLNLQDQLKKKFGAK